ncbi:hypothetical protein Trydic_g14229 [Trypoxylus dichotomus]
MNRGSGSSFVSPIVLNINSLRNKVKKRENDAQDKCNPFLAPARDNNRRSQERLPSDEINRSNPQRSDSEECVDDSDDDRIHVKALRFDSQPLPGFSGPTHPFSRNIAADS